MTLGRFSGGVRRNGSHDKGLCHAALLIPTDAPRRYTVNRSD